MIDRVSGRVCEREGERKWLTRNVAFITAYKKGCVDLGMRLRDITGEWGMFDTLSSSSTIGLGRTQVSTGPSTETAPGMQTKTKTSTLMEATEMRGSTTRNSITTTATPTTRLVTRTTTVAAVSTISKTPADIQIPICGVCASSSPSLLLSLFPLVRIHGQLTIRVDSPQMHKTPRSM